MAAPSLVPSNSSRRRLPRYVIDVSLDVIALQSGIPYNMPGRCCDLSEAGLGAVVAGELTAGQSVALELRLPNVGLPVRARALVRYQAHMRCGLQFVGLTVEQREKIRYWSSKNAAQLLPAPASVEAVPVSAPPEPMKDSTPDKRMRRFRVQRRRFLVLVAFMIAVATFGWWEWQKAWNELETVSTAEAQVAGGIPLRVPWEMMNARITFKVDPVYPDAARQAGLQGLVVLDTVIAADGAVRQVRPLAGPEELSQSAVDAVRSWRYEPYRVQGRAVEVETTVSVDFRLH